MAHAGVVGARASGSAGVVGWVLGVWAQAKALEEHVVLLAPAPLLASSREPCGHRHRLDGQSVPAGAGVPAGRKTAVSGARCADRGGRPSAALAPPTSKRRFQGRRAARFLACSQPSRRRGSIRSPARRPQDSDGAGAWERATYRSGCTAGQYAGPREVHGAWPPQRAAAPVSSYTG